MNKGDYMVHWSGKVCMVEDMAEMNLTGTKRMYFILTPVRDKAEKIYVPIEKTEGTLRPVPSRKEAVSLAGRIRDIEHHCIAAVNRRFLFLSYRKKASFFCLYL